MPNNYALAVKIGTLRLICLYLPPSMPTHEALDILSAITLTDDTIILTGDYASNPRGIALEQWLEERSLTVLNGVLSLCTPTYISFRNEVEISSIIDLFITNTNFANPSLHIATELSLGSDHQLLSLSFTYDLQHLLPAPPPMCQTWNLSRLYEDDTLFRICQLYVHPLMLLLTLPMHSFMTLLVAQLVLAPLAPHIGNRFGPLNCKLQLTIKMVVTSNDVELVALTRSIGGAGTSMHTRSFVSKFRQQIICLGMLFAAQ
ncbi:hypothetical protein PHYBLDRAFT_161850 [Phycomyces blakesleeanus NRRL 1555(-)]|uniref:Endonuclease/exonuclease/phosphatase domain-containing protein n=1 Tax=Phycomyces blakesleeanus (strain ATCC 8743b / DSM 1359 / FGSC 10004 / NBRC 33097 / NRRL 1555) TaxID=763407 RepID=A0A167RAH8_PHYB8|nr:hypothetical protein PHYBLDRAFT_161850 [Phycomyces blakesleeanus NRRL 1555(-)]OAD81227.1 hypothetical protein PHYBLDRAFT_161850 [Phycomyces blakesleeanus NRRL 1555(-)]|eukprot:XP_018299267.1 hypothetical protein PHYBLDRAFT_161850 [Phycomyces blakesleeanus NRRL 1555(-)]